MNEPQVGDVWERDGKRRKVVRVEAGRGRGWFDVWWNGRRYPTWCSTWKKWASKATLVERDGEAVGNEFDPKITTGG